MLLQALVAANRGVSLLQGVLGYVILRPMMTAVGVVGQLLGVYGDGELRFDRVYLYTTVVSNVSQVCNTSSL